MVIQAIQAEKAYLSAKPALAPTAKPSEPGEALSNVAKSFAETLQHSETTAKAAMVGKADPQALVTALAQTELAIETAATLRDKVVEAYQEILRMPV